MWQVGITLGASHCTCSTSKDEDQLDSVIASASGSYLNTLEMKNIFTSG